MLELVISVVIIGAALFAWWLTATAEEVFNEEDGE